MVSKNSLKGYIFLSVSGLLFSAAIAEQPVAEESISDNLLFPVYLSCEQNFSSWHSFESENSNPSVTKQPIHIVSESWDSTQSTSVLSGNVRLTQDGQRLRADTLQANDNTQQYDAQGNIVFSTAEISVQADSLHYDAASSQTDIRNTEFLLFSNRGNGSAEQVSIDANRQISLFNTEFSTCPKDPNNEGSRSWAFESDEIILDSENGWGEAYGSTIKVADIPIFYLPYMTFPIDDRRKTGLLPPTFSNSSRNGADLALPYYFNLAPNYDLTLTPRYLSKRGTMLGAEFRHLGESSYNELAFNGLDKDRELATRDSRWQYTVKHQSQWSENWSASINASKVSDDSYFQDFGGSLENSNLDTLSQQAAINYNKKDWQFALEYYDWQLLNSPTQRYSIAPRLKLQRYFEPRDSSFYGSIYAEATRFEHEVEQGATRLHIEPSFGWSNETLYSFVRPQLSFAHTQYQEKDIFGDQITTDRSLPTVSVDSGLYFERFLDGNAGRQTLEPRLFYVYTPYKDQSNLGLYDTLTPTFNFTQLFARNRFSGIDRIGDSNQVSAALTSRVFDQNGHEKLSVTVGRSVYLRDREVQLHANTPAQTDNQSGLLAEINWRWTDDIEIKSAIEWDDQTNTTQHGLINVHYEPQENHIINLGHRYRVQNNQEHEEAELAFAWPIHDNWRLLGRYSQDLTENRTNDSFLGLEYESCCWAVRLVARRYLNIQLDASGQPLMSQTNEHSSSVLLQFVLKGIGSLRGNTSDFLQDSIYGYKDKLGK